MVLSLSIYARDAMKRSEIPFDQRPGSAYFDLVNVLATTGYEISSYILDAADYGVPQHRKRLIMLGATEGGPIPPPEPTHGDPESMEVSMGQLRPWVTVRKAIRRFKDTDPSHQNYGWWGRYIKEIPPGGCWRDLPEPLQELIMGKAFKATGGRTSFLRRLAWDRPAPCLVTSPRQLATCLCHPVEDRPLTVGEYKRLQGFPRGWKLEGGLRSKYRLLGQATPPPLAKAVAQAIRLHMESMAS